MTGGLFFLRKRQELLCAHMDNMFQQVVHQGAVFHHVEFGGQALADTQTVLAKILEPAAVENFHLRSGNLT